MRFLVTGGCGFVGTNLVRMLVRQGHEVLNVDKLTYAGNTASLYDIEADPRYRLCVADICDRASLEKAFDDFRPDAVIHLAAESHVDRSIDGPAAFIQTNVVGTFTLLAVAGSYWHRLSQAARHRFRLLHVSTDEVYGSLGDIGQFTEATPYDPRSPYSASKASSDHLVRAWFHTYGLPVLVTNCSNNYGPYQFPEKLIPVTILRALRDEQIPVYGDGQHVRDWLHVEDHCRALLAVVAQGQPGETYNVGGNNELRNLDLVRKLCEILDEFEPRAGGRRYADLIRFVADRPGHDRRYAIDASKIHRELQWRPLHDRESGLRETVRWYIENRRWWENLEMGGGREHGRWATGDRRLEA